MLGRIEEQSVGKFRVDNAHTLERPVAVVHIIAVGLKAVEVHRSTRLFIGRNQLEKVERLAHVHQGGIGESDAYVVVLLSGFGSESVHRHAEGISFFSFFIVEAGTCALHFHREIRLLAGSHVHIVGFRIAVVGRRHKEISVCPYLLEVVKTLSATEIHIVHTQLVPVYRKIVELS